MSLAAAGLLVMVGMLIWSFRLDKDFSGHYETANFHRSFWDFFFVGAGLLSLGSLGLCGTLEARSSKRAGIGTLVTGFAFIILLMPFIDFEGWTGASAYTLTAVVFAGAAILLVSAGIQWLRLKVWPPK